MEKEKILKKLLILIIIIVLFIIGLVLADNVLGLLKNSYPEKEREKSSFSASKESQKGISFVNDIMRTITKFFAGEIFEDKFKKPESLPTTTNDSENSSVNITYSPVNIDDVILLYEGKQNGRSVKELLNRLIDNTNQTLYSYITVTSKGVGQIDKQIAFSDKDSYISELQNLLNNINDSSNYNISFGLNELKTQINEIIIEKN